MLTIVYGMISTYSTHLSKRQINPLIYFHVRDGGNQGRCIQNDKGEEGTKLRQLSNEFLDKSKTVVVCKELSLLVSCNTFPKHCIFFMYFWDEQHEIPINKRSLFVSSKTFPIHCIFFMNTLDEREIPFNELSLLVSCNMFPIHYTFFMYFWDEHEIQFNRWSSFVFSNMFPIHCIFFMDLWDEREIHFKRRAGQTTCKRPAGIRTMGLSSKRQIFKISKINGIIYRIGFYSQERK